MSISWELAGAQRVYHLFEVPSDVPGKLPRSRHLRLQFRRGLEEVCRSIGRRQEPGPLGVYQPGAGVGSRPRGIPVGTGSLFDLNGRLDRPLLDLGWISNTLL